MTQDRKEYMKAYYKAHKEEIKAQSKARYDEHKEEIKAYNEAHKEERKANNLEWRLLHREEYNAKCKAYKKSDVNSFGKTKHSIRTKSRYYLSKHGKKIKGYEIHHCCTYNEPYKFIYCNKEMHLQIHAYLREHNIDADSNHYEQIKHLLDNTVVLYGIV